MIQPIEAGDIYGIKETRLLIDVRSPSEYLNGHIPGAINIPLFTDRERAEVGTLYKRAGKDAALLIGLDFAGAGLSGYVKRLHALSRGKAKEVAVYCWRGGMRSASMAWLFGTAGYRVYLLQGGYKAYRSYIREASGKGVAMRVLGGMTGSGKTEILHELRRMGEQVIDLEQLACNKGSVFGYLGQPAQPTNEQFENNLADVWLSLDGSKPVWIEDESRSIGTVSQPGPFFEQMKSQPMVLLDVPPEIRVGRLMQEYAVFGREQLSEALGRIAQPLGGQGIREALNALETGDVAPAIRVALGYYDKMYKKALAKFNGRQIITVESSTGRAAENASLILKRVSENILP